MLSRNKNITAECISKYILENWDFELLADNLNLPINLITKYKKWCYLKYIFNTKQCMFKVKSNIETKRIKYKLEWFLNNIYLKPKFFYKYLVPLFKHNRNIQKNDFYYELDLFYLSYNPYNYHTQQIECIRSSKIIIQNLTINIIKYT